MTDGKIKILFENEYFVAVDKASAVLTVPSRMGVDDVRPVLGIQLQSRLNKKIFPIHRLDFEVSGIVLFALSSESHQQANHWFETKQVRKRYVAVTENQNFDHWPKDIPCDATKLESVTAHPLHWKSKLLRGKRRTYESPHGDTAETIAEITNIDNHKNRVQWLLQPLTGRSHQLRYELSRHGFPILGDKLYGSRADYKESAIALRAIQLDFSDIKSDRWGLPEILEVTNSGEEYL